MTYFLWGYSMLIESEMLTTVTLTVNTHTEVV